MVIWFALLIPVAAAVFLLGWYKEDTKWWELAIPFVIAAICITSAKLVSEKYQVRDKELWGFNTIRAEHYEPYSYWTTCSETYVCGSDSEGNIKTCTRFYPCVRHVSRACYLIDQFNSKHVRISYAKYQELAKRWGSSVFVELHREKTESIEDDGDMYMATWPAGNWELSEPIAEMHTYENRIQAASSVYNFQEISEEDVQSYGLYKYPAVPGYEVITILDSDRSNWGKADKYFRYLNGTLGPKRKLRMWVLVFRGQPIDAAKYQEAYWKGGNKNEFIYCLGTDKSGENITWAEVISWCDQPNLKIKGRDFASKLDKLNEDSLIALANFSQKELGSSFMRKDFREFSYLSVEPTGTAVVITYIIVLLTTGGVCFWVVKNDFTDRVRSRGRYRY